MNDLAQSAATAPGKSLVFIVGAGASKEVGLPVGGELKSQIADVLDIRFDSRGDGRRISGSPEIYDAYRRLIDRKNVGRNANGDLQRTGWAIRDAMPLAESIDNYIDAHNTNPLVAVCGKLAIAKCILDAERKSTIFGKSQDYEPKPDFSKSDQTWFNQFFKLLIQGSTFADLPRKLSTIAFITFNYDRCIERFLHAALMTYYRINADAATEALGHLQIFHPYGSLGALPSAKSEDDAVPFGMEPSADLLISIAHRLKTFTEGTDEIKSEVKLIRETLRCADRLVYLGFAYNKQNLDLLYGGSEKRPRTLGRNCVFGTAKGISASDTKLIKQELVDRGYHDTDRTFLERDRACADLFHEFQRSLAIA